MSDFEGFFKELNDWATKSMSTLSSLQRDITSSQDPQEIKEMIDNLKKELAGRKQTYNTMTDGLPSSPPESEKIFSHFNVVATALQDIENQNNENLAEKAANPENKDQVQNDLDRLVKDFSDGLRQVGEKNPDDAHIRTCLERLMNKFQQDVDATKEEMAQQTSRPRMGRSG